MHELKSRMEDLEQLAALALAHPRATPRIRRLINEALRDFRGMVLFAMHFENPKWIAEATETIEEPIRHIERFFLKFAVKA
ncbi:hypothetical protein Mterra_01615 [Calidithermus terrae]|uniref:Uncharacterized protein n=1 Tax=Calidithermus terrae TaxID=1408545 RepID=A0A399EP52_9DEIN|nr:hypothetical protein [Calidithermus terrae]RIH85758.1 hypothetical protein Mterra_01615 [Calidithermus terrae]